MPSIKDYEKHDKNPFLGEVVSRKGHKLFRTGDKYTLVDKWGEVTNEVGIMTIRREVDKSAFVKLYMERISDIFALEKREYQVFGWIVGKMEKDKSQVHIDRKLCMEQLSISKGTLIAGLSGLLEKEFIAKTGTQNIFFINPAIAFNGNRLVLLYEHNDNT